MSKSKFLLEFLTKNFKPLFSENELGALGNIATRDDLTKEFGTLPSYEITGDQIRDAHSSLLPGENINLPLSNFLFFINE